MSKEYKEYISKLENDLNTIYELAKKARAKGLDPESVPETKIAKDLAGLVEGFIGPPGVAERIRELSLKMPREDVAFKIAEEIIYGKFGHMEEQEAAEQAIRTALAILTEGVTAAVYSQGIARVSIKTNPDRSKYLAIYLAGPIRSAGGTETALTPVVADFVRRLLGLDRYKPTQEEIERFVAELRLYEREVSRFQYRVSDEELKRVLQYLPVEVTGTQSNPVEVSSYRNLPRIETNGVRGGALRVVNDGLIGRSAKVLAVVEDLGIQGWDWLRDIREIQRKKTGGFMEDVPAGRPILSYSSRRGGFRLRYGRARNTGLAAVGVHPVTMFVLQNFLAGGTQLKIEVPGKSCIVLPVDYIEPPIARLKDGSVIRVSLQNFRRIKNKIDKILFLGDILLSFGDFLYNNKALLPSGYTEEWWREDLSLSIEKNFNGSIESAAASAKISISRLEALLKNPFDNIPSAEEAISLSLGLKIPLHPLYTYFWSNISSDDLLKIRRWLLNVKIRIKGNIVSGINGPLDVSVKELLEKVCVPHKVFEDEIVIEGDAAHVFAYCMGFQNSDRKIKRAKTVLENITELSSLRLRDKAPSFIGARVGRPEKAKRREMKPLVHVLFPVGLAGGSRRDLISASRRNSLNVEIVRRRCPKCQTVTFKTICLACGLKTSLETICPKCGRTLSEKVCPVCKVSTVNFEKQVINIKRLVDEACKKIGFTPSHIKGVKGLTNKTKTPEIIEKGVLRAKYGLSVYKDGTVRFDATNAPLTHFKPSEIGVPLEKIRQLGYYYDYEGKPLLSPDQICELKIQDVVIPRKGVEYLIHVAKFIDELLEKIYGLKPFYNIRRAEDLVGHLIVGLAPHTCAGVLGRVIGFTKMNVCFAHPFWHSAKRRDCDGDEDSLILAMDMFLNFSEAYLPAQIGGIMDSPLFIIRVVNPQEVQRQAHEIDASSKYPLLFYEHTWEGTSPRRIIDIMDIIKHRFGRETQFQGFYYTVPVSDINLGNVESVYKTLKRMTDKLNRQLELAEMIEAVDAREVAQIVLTTHFIRDISGNLRAFTTQSFRCKVCNKRFRRLPLTGKCTRCEGELTLTVYRGGIEKYLENARRLVKKYELPEYYAQRLALVEDEIDSLFESGKSFKQAILAKFVES